MHPWWCRISAIKSKSEKLPHFKKDSLVGETFCVCQSLEKEHSIQSRDFDDFCCSRYYKWLRRAFNYKPSYNIRSSLSQKNGLILLPAPNYLLVGGFNPSGKDWLKMDHFPKVRGDLFQTFETTT